MDLEIHLPLPDKYLPDKIIDLLENGGKKFSDFVTDWDVGRMRVDDNCAFCTGPLDSDNCSDFVWDYLGYGRQHSNDCLVVDTNACPHRFHAGCLHYATQQGTGVNKCPVCRKEWFTSSEDLLQAHNVRTLVNRFSHGEIITPSFLQLDRDLLINAANLSTRLAVAAYAYRAGFGPYFPPRLQLWSRNLLEAIILDCRAIDGLLIGPKTFVLRLWNTAIRCMLEDFQMISHANILLPFVHAVTMQGIENWVHCEPPYYLLREVEDELAQAYQELAELGDGEDQEDDDGGGVFLEEQESEEDEVDEIVLSDAE